MKKIEIVTFSRAHNYGAMLQAYALEETLIKRKYDTTLLNYRDKFIEKEYRIFKINRTNIITIIKSIVKDIIFFNKNVKRYMACKKFEDNNLLFGNIEYKDAESLKNYKNADILIAGSDQIWNMKITNGLSDVYTLNFGDKNIKKISYAASIGDIDLMKENTNCYKLKIKNIDNISVREEDAKIELDKIMEKKINVVVDPTLLLNVNDWNHAIKNIQVINQNYIVAYVIQPDEEYVKIVNYLSEKTGLKIVHFGVKNPGYKNILKCAYTEGPLEFINYIKNAKYVVATSFHATIFSILFNKKFFIIPHKKTGSRVTNLLKKLNISGRTFESFDEFKNIDYDFETDWEKVNKKLQEEREESISWLKNAIEG